MTEKVQDRDRDRARVRREDLDELEAATKSDAWGPVNVYALVYAARRLVRNAD
jgi:hypothetical protein